MKREPPISFRPSKKNKRFLKRFKPGKRSAKINEGVDAVRLKKFLAVSKKTFPQ